MTRYIIIANGDIMDYQWHKDIITENDFIVCADGGARHAIEMDIIPDVVLGDFDSMPEHVQDVLQGTKCDFYKYPAEKDQTDTELALNWCLKENPDEIILLGALGQRLDHSLANIFLLAKVTDGISVRIINEHNEIRFVRDKTILEGCPGEYVSLLPATPEIKGISTKGLKYMMRTDSLEMGTSRGVANEMVGEQASIELDEGVGIVIQAWDKPRCKK